MKGTTNQETKRSSKIAVIRLVLTAALSMALVFMLAACGGSTPPPSGGAEGGGAGTTDGGGAATEGLQTITPGKLTIATGEPAWEPWVMNDAPESGEGFEAAIAYAVAEQLGFAKADVVWVRTGFEEAIQPGAKNYDLNLQQYSITPERRAVVDFSSPYYKTPYVIIVNSDGKYANATTLAELKDALFGGPSGDVIIQYTQDKVQPASEVQIFNDLAIAAQAMDANQIDAMVVDVATADYLVSSGQIARGKIIGVIPGSDSITDGIAFILEKDSPLTPAVTKAVDDLMANGTIPGLQAKWLSQYDYPSLG